MHTFVILFFMMIFVTSGSSMAEETGATQKSKMDNPYVEVMNKNAKALAESLTKEEAQTLGIIRENFGFLHSVNVARRSVDEAVSLCAAHNKSLKKPITTRHKEWDKNIGNIIKKQEKSLDRAIDKDYFQNPDEIHRYLDSINNMATYAEDHIEKNIVTTPEACQSLMDSMDKTESVIVKILTDISWPEGIKDIETEETTP